MINARRILYFSSALFLLAGCTATETLHTASNLTPTRAATKQNTRGITVTLSATETPRASLTPTETSAPPHTATHTATTAPTNTPTRHPTHRPQPTATVTPPPLQPAFTPAFPDGWFHTVRFVPADVAPGQNYWRLVAATFCDVPPPGQKEKTCPDLPGDILDHTVYVAVLDENAACVENPPLLHEINTGERIPLTMKPQAFPWTTCATVYEWSMYGESNDFWLDGLPSDRIGGLLLNSPQLNWSENRAHVRYFLIFQRMTR